MTALSLLADDLTGALDAAAPFAAVRAPIGVTWLDEATEDDAPLPARMRWPQGDAAVSTSSRGLPAELAIRRVSWFAPWLARGMPAFKKIDSLARGNTAAEIVAAHRAGGFERTVVCPAFPSQGRIMRGGRLFVRTASGEQAGPDLAELLRAAGADDALVAHDAATDEDLEDLVRSRSGQDGVLWAGSSGLARALAGPVMPLPMPPASRSLLVTASRHPMARALIEALRGAAAPTLLRDDGVADPATLGAAAAARLDAGGPVVLDASPPVAIEAAAARMARCFAAFAAGRRPGLLAVVGGDTLARMLGAVACTRLCVCGEVRPGLPLASLADGAWAGTLLLSRAGGFDDGGAILRALGAEPMDA